MSLKNTVISIFVVFVAALLLREGEPEPYAHWSYGEDEGPQNWASLDERYAVCEQGIIQSPINITSNEVINATLPDLEFSNKAKAKNFVFNGHALQLNFPKGNELKIENKVYNLKQLHFHTPSENTIDGKSFPMEGHFVHTKGKEIAVVALMFKEGRESAFFNKILRNMPDAEENKKELKSKVLPYDILPSSKKYFTFNGSLTTPPCTQGVKWIVLRTPIEVSKDQIKDFTDVINNNNRPVQKTNSRIILK
ncbi:MAG: carbonic anhydrase family protein [Arcobacter sp.]|nr:carbonic anhydrase family protein [Arcobacter sp.]